MNVGRIVAQIVADIAGKPVYPALEDRINKELPLATEVHNERLALEKAMRDEEGRHCQVMNNLKEDKTILQEKCLHWMQTYHGDPAGGSDSYHECQVCGKHI